MTTNRPTRPSDLPDHAGVLFHPPLLFGLCLVMGLVGRRITRLEFLPAPDTRLAGWMIIGAALLVFGWAVLTLRSRNTSVRTQDPTTAVVSGGPFRYTRNPIYLSMMAVILGAGVGANCLWFLLLIPPAMIAMTKGVIVREEAYLERKFGEEYTAYKSRVRRWL